MKESIIMDVAECTRTLFDDVLDAAFIDPLIDVHLVDVALNEFEY